MSKIALLKTKSFRLLFVIAIFAGIGFAFAVDTDNDGMSDLYEEFFKLDPTSSTDATENYDTDLLNNLQESQIWTDPAIADTDADGFADHEDDQPLSRAVAIWGYP
ncbi:hypothetical protein P4C99_18455, partial [Pontiellaceae bacterium B1224]|nr:hypothetical protein [Pontiellaceae bacterium B1224]